MRINSINHEIEAASLEQTRREYEQQRQWRELERHAELMRCMYTVPSYRVEFSAMLPDDKGFMINNVIYVPESKAYKFIFMNNRVDDTTIGFAMSHALQKINRFIDNYKV